MPDDFYVATIRTNVFCMLGTRNFVSRLELPTLHSIKISQATQALETQTLAEKPSRSRILDERLKGEASTGNAKERRSSLPMFIIVCSVMLCSNPISKINLTRMTDITWHAVRTSTQACSKGDQEKYYGAAQRRLIGASKRSPARGDQQKLLRSRAQFPWVDAETSTIQKYNQKYCVVPVPSYLYLGANVRTHHICAPY